MKFTKIGGFSFNKDDMMTSSWRRNENVEIFFSFFKIFLCDLESFACLVCALSICLFYSVDKLVFVRVWGDQMEATLFPGR